MSRDKPMTDTRLAEIVRLSFHVEKYAAGEMAPPDAIEIDLALGDLLTEVVRLRTREIERMMEEER